MVIYLNCWDDYQALLSTIDPKSKGKLLMRPSKSFAFYNFTTAPSIFNIKQNADSLKTSPVAINKHTQQNSHYPYRQKYKIRER